MIPLPCPAIVHPGWGQLWGTGPGTGTVDGGKVRGVRFVSLHGRPYDLTREGEPVWMRDRNGRIRFYTAGGRQVGPEHDHLAAAVSWAAFEGWVDSRAGERAPFYRRGRDGRRRLVERRYELSREATSEARTFSTGEGARRRYNEIVAEQEDEYRRRHPVAAARATSSPSTSEAAS